MPMQHRLRLDPWRTGCQGVNSFHDISRNTRVSRNESRFKGISSVELLSLSIDAKAWKAYKWLKMYALARN